MMRKLVFFLISTLLIFECIPLAFASGEKVVVVVSTPADAIVAAPYAKAMGYELVYTPRDSLSDEAKEKLKDATKVIIIGGPVAVSNNVENQIKYNLGIKTERIWGETRVETSQEVFKVLIKDKPEMAKNIVIVEGFNEKISPVAVSFNTPVLYYAPGKEKKVIETLKSVRAENAVILGTSIPKEIQKVVTSVSKNTIIAYGKPEDVIKIAISAASKLNPELKDKPAVIVYAEKSKNPVLESIVKFVKGEVGVVVSLPHKNEDVVKDIINKLSQVTTTVSVASDTSDIIEIVSKISSKVGVTATTTTIIGGGGGGHHHGGGGGGYVPPEKYTTISINDGQKIIKIADIDDDKEDGNYVEVNGEENIVLPDIKIITNAVDKDYYINGNHVSIKFEGNLNNLNLIYPIKNGAITYGDNVTVTFYGSKALANKEVTLHIITSRQDLRDAMNNLLNGDADKLLNLLNNSPVKITKTTDSYGDATFNVAPQKYGENIIVITEGDGNIGNKVTILGVGGFEHLKYKLNIKKIDYFDGTASFNLSLNQTPTNPVRYGLLIIVKNGYKGNISIVGTSPNDKYFNVSVVGDKNSETIVKNSDLIKLNASKVKNIIETIFNSNTAGAWYSDVTNKDKVTADITSDIAEGKNCYAIGVVYEPDSKKIVALKQIEITLG